MGNQPAKGPRFQRVFRWAALILAVVILITVALFIFANARIRAGMESDLVFYILQEHLRAVVGLPVAVFASLFVVLVLRMAHGPIEFEAVGFKFRGASGPLVMWLLCFIIMILAFYLLW